tara:strand:+ start:176 stop:430 length:255 start_codon:yes stop_codon:yes gene_type:complete
MTQQPTLPPIKTHGRKKVHRTTRPMNQEEIKVLGHTDAELIELLQGLELRLRFDKDSGFPINILTVRLIKRIRDLLINSKGEGV